MMSPGTILMLALTGLGGHGSHKAREGACDTCGVETRAMIAEIQCLQSSPRGRKREEAAKDLRKVDWHCHPEVVSALATALLTDGKDNVREEAAESLGKMAASTPEAHQALTTASAGDPDRGVRHEARKALKRLKSRCDGTCVVCGPAPGGIAPTAPPDRAIVVPDDQPPAQLVLPPNLGPPELLPAEPVPPLVIPGDPPAVASPGDEIPLEPPKES